MINNKLFRKGETVAVALSGGKDSMFLLDNLINEAFSLSVTVKAINIDHSIRGDESERDSDFVRDFCKSKNVDLYFKKIECVAYSEKNGLTLEQGARKLRYEVFFEAIASGFCDVVVTAHHLSDNAETVLFNLFRGSGLSGVTGIDETAYDGKIVRPILNISRDEIDCYIQKHNIPFVTDSTNSDTDYTRNYIRNILMPQIKKKFPEAEFSISRFSELAKNDNEFLDSLAEKYIEKDNNRISLKCGIPKALFGRAAILAMKQSGIEKDYEKIHIDDLLKLAENKNGSEISLPLNVKAVKEYGKITFYKPEAKNASKQKEIPFAVGKILFDSRELNITACNGLENGALCFDGDKVPKTAVIRFRNSDDTFTKFGGGTKKLNDYLTDKKIPRMQRDAIPLVADGGKILIIAGIEISDSIKVDKSTVNMLKLTYPINFH